MSVTGEPPDELHTFREHWTTIVLKERHDGTWLATQSGVSIEETGDTAGRFTVRRVLTPGGLKT